MVHWHQAALQRVRKSIGSRGDVDEDERLAQTQSQTPLVPPSAISTATALPPPASRPSSSATRSPDSTPPISRVSGAFYIPNSVAQRASVYMRPEDGAALRRQLAFDALALVRQLPLAAQGWMYVKRDTSRMSLFRSQWLQFWGELRGGMLLFFDPDAPASSPDPSTRPIQLVFTATKCILDLKNTMSYSQVKLRREDGTSLLLRFSEPQEAQRWCALLQTHTLPYTTVRLADFDWITAIGKGASGKVFLVRDNRTNARLALKVIDKAKVFRTQLTFQHVVNERLVLEMCVGCPFLIQIRYAFQTDVHLYFATDFYDGGDVFSLLQTNKGRLSERHARRLIAEVVLALSWLHERNIVYRDLKPENVVLDGDGHIRLADFGLAKVLCPSENFVTQTICGTTAYAAPEMLQARPYDVSLDLWCLGVFIYHILVGRTPFNFKGRTMEEMEEMQRTKQVRYSSSLSLEAVSLVKSLLQNDPSRRPSLEAIKRHRFFANVDWVRVARKEPHPDGLAQFVADKSQKDSLIARLATARAQMGDAGLSQGVLPPVDNSEVNSTTLDKYLLRNINEEEWRHVSFSEDEDISTAAEFPAVLRGKGKDVETWAIAAWAWTCCDPGGSSFVGNATGPNGLGSLLEARTDSSTQFAVRRSLPERYATRLATDRVDATPLVEAAAHSRPSLPTHHRELPPRYRSVQRRSFRRREAIEEAYANGSLPAPENVLRHHSAGHDRTKELDRKDVRLDADVRAIDLNPRPQNKFGRVASQSEKRPRQTSGRRHNVMRRSAEYPRRSRVSRDYSAIFSRRSEEPEASVFSGDRTNRSQA